MSVNQANGLFFLTNYLINMLLSTWCVKVVVDGGDSLEFDGLEATTNTLFTVTITHAIQNCGF